MPQPQVWSEHEAAGINFRNCTYCAGLMVLVHGGKTDYPKGIFTEAEQKALRAADTSSTPETFEGMSHAVRARYGVNLHLVPDQSRAGIAAAMRVRGRAYAIAGKLANFPPGHTLRRFAPNFTGFHAVTYLPDGQGAGHWLDPMAPMRHQGQNVTVEQVLQFVGTNFPLDARFLAAEELAEMLTTITRYPAPRTWLTKGGTLTGRRLGPPPLSLAGTFDAGSPAHSDAEFQIDPTPVGWQAGPYQRVVDGPLRGFLIPDSQVTLEPVPLGGDCTAQVKAATDPLRAEIATLTEQVAALTNQIEEAASAAQ